jgi:DNA-binding transcriptional regulator LsrR (DeoR family)
MDDTRAFPLSIGVAGGLQKVGPISGALRGRYLKTLVTDEPTAASVLEAQATAVATAKE